MPIYLNAIGPWGQDTLQQIAAKGYDGIRSDVWAHTADQCCSELVNGPPRLNILFLLTPFWDVHVHALALARAIRDSGIANTRSVAVEFGNELDIDPDFRSNPKLVAKVTAIWAVAFASLNVALVIGGISNLKPKSLDYLQRMLATGLIPPHAVIGFHRYQTEYAPDVSLPGYGSRAEEWTALRQIIGHRSAWCTETGYHTAPQRRGWRGWFRKVQWTDEQVSAHLAREIEIQRAAGIPVTTLYQITDGPETDPIDRFGRRRVDGTWKPAIPGVEQ